MKKKSNKRKSIGLPGGPNEFINYAPQLFSTEGYKTNSPDVNNPYNIIPSGDITMKDVDFPVMGTDNLGNQQLMQPGFDYKFPGDMVFEEPRQYKKGGEQNTINKYGRSLPKFQSKGQVNEPLFGTQEQIDSYADSLNLYNDAQSQIKYFRKLGINPGEFKIPTKDVNPSINDVRGFYSEKDIKTLNRIKPLYYLSGSKNKNSDGAYETSLLPVFKKPVQPYILDTRDKLEIQKLPIKTSPLPVDDLPTEIIYPTREYTPPPPPPTKLEQMQDWMKNIDLGDWSINSQNSDGSAGTSFNPNLYNHYRNQRKAFSKDNPLDFINPAVIGAYPTDKDGRRGRFLGLFNEGGSLPEAQWGALGRAAKPVIKKGISYLKSFFDDAVSVTDDVVEEVVKKNPIAESVANTPKTLDRPPAEDHIFYRNTDDGSSIMKPLDFVNTRKYKTWEAPQNLSFFSPNNRAFDGYGANKFGAKINPKKPFYEYSAKTYSVEDVQKLMEEGYDAIITNYDKADIRDAYQVIPLDKSIITDLEKLRKYGGEDLPVAQWGALGNIIKQTLKQAPKYVDDFFRSSNKFTSEIDWGAFNKAIPENKILMQEYNLIEETTKANKTWMKNADGSAFNGTPEQFVQMKSGNFQKAFGNTMTRDAAGNIQIVTHKTDEVFDAFDPNQIGSRTDEGFHGRGFYFHAPEVAPYYGNYYGNINMPSYVNTDKVVKGRLGTDPPDFLRNMEYLTDNPNNIKSAVGNDGMFNLTNPNIYKQWGGGLANTIYKFATDSDYKWTDALYDYTLAPLSNALDVLSVPGALVAEAGEYFGERGDKEFNFTDAMPALKGDYSFKNMNDGDMKTLSGIVDDDGNPLVENPWGAFALDVLTDPSTYVGVGAVKSLVKPGVKASVPIVKNIVKSTDDIVKATADDMVEVFTSDGSKKLIKKTDAVRLNRIEDANVNNKTFTNYEDGNWFSDEIQPFYLNKSKNTLNGGFLNPADPKRVMSVYLDPADAKLFDVSSQGTSVARNMSGGVGNLPIKGEYVLPPDLVKIMREGTSGPGYNTMIGNSESIMKNLDSFYKKLGGGLLPKAQEGEETKGQLMFDQDFYNNTNNTQQSDRTGNNSSYELENKKREEKATFELTLDKDLNSKMSDEDFRVKYGTNRHTLRMNYDTQYREKVEKDAIETSKSNGTIKSQRQSNLDNMGNNPNSQWIVGASNQQYGTPEQKANTAAFHNNVIGAVVPIPGLEALKLTNALKLPGLIDDAVLPAISKVFKGQGTLKKLDNVGNINLSTPINKSDNIITETINTKDLIINKAADPHKYLRDGFRPLKEYTDPNSPHYNAKILKIIEDKQKYLLSPEYQRLHMESTGQSPKMTNAITSMYLNELNESLLKITSQGKLDDALGVYYKNTRAPHNLSASAPAWKNDGVGHIGVVNNSTDVNANMYDVFKHEAGHLTSPTQKDDMFSEIYASMNPHPPGTPEYTEFMDFNVGAKWRNYPRMNVKYKQGESLWERLTSGNFFENTRKLDHTKIHNQSITDYLNGFAEQQTRNLGLKELLIKNGWDPNSPLTKDIINKSFTFNKGKIDFSNIRTDIKEILQNLNTGAQSIKPGSQKWYDEIISKIPKTYQKGGDLLKAQNGEETNGVKYGTSEYADAYYNLGDGKGGNLLYPSGDPTVAGMKYLPEVKINTFSDGINYPYFDYLTKEEKSLFRNEGPIGSSLRAKALYGYGINGNQTYMDSVDDFVLTASGIPQTLTALQIPQSLLTESLAMAKGEDYNMSDAFGGFTGGKQRYPSDVYWI
jgi:hypothetical protein